MTVIDIITHDHDIINKIHKTDTETKSNMHVFSLHMPQLPPRINGIINYSVFLDSVFVEFLSEKNNQWNKGRDR